MTQYQGGDWNEARRARLMEERHAIATQAVAEGVGPVVASKRMGLTTTYAMYRWAKTVGVADTDLWIALRGEAKAPPMTDQEKADRIEDVEWLADSGVTDREAARRLGLSPLYLERWLLTQGRGDLWTRLARYKAFAYDRNLQEVR